MRKKLLVDTISPANDCIGAITTHQGIMHIYDILVRLVKMCTLHHQSARRRLLDLSASEPDPPAARLRVSTLSTKDAVAGWNS
jgi:hypothetical protein